MIWTHLTAIMIILGVFGLAIMLYSVPKAYLISKKIAKASMEEKYELEKSFYLLSTVVWVILITRIIASALFWITNESLIPIIPGAMCQFGVNQAGAPYSWIDNVVKLIILLVYGNWLILDLVNRKVKGAPLMSSLSRLFLIITPLLFLDLILDLAFYFTLSPVVVPCCRIVFTAETPVPCPYCFIFHDAPMFIVVIASYGLSISLNIWSLTLRRYIRKYPEIESVALDFMKKLIIFSLGFAILGTIALIPGIIQVMGPAVPVH
ncbi:MAG: hypothetical protein QXW62_00135 [Candidatus Methanomethylicaceae archaeon]|nr:hypothetical protein [Candidatus Verstraetearchaeota archaeon]